MDAAERQFRITIELEDFIGVRTVKDIARDLQDNRQAGSASLQHVATATEPGFAQNETLSPHRMKRV